MIQLVQLRFCWQHPTYSIILLQLTLLTDLAEYIRDKLIRTVNFLSIFLTFVGISYQGEHFKARAMAGPGKDRTSLANLATYVGAARIELLQEIEQRRMELWLLKHELWGHHAITDQRSVHSRIADHFESIDAPQIIDDLNSYRKKLEDFYSQAQSKGLLDRWVESVIVKSAELVAIDVEIARIRYWGNPEGKGVPDQRTRLVLEEKFQRQKQFILSDKRFRFLATPKYKAISLKKPWLPNKLQFLPEFYYYGLQPDHFLYQEIFADIYLPMSRAFYTTLQEGGESVYLTRQDEYFSVPSLCRKFDPTTVKSAGKKAIRLLTDFARCDLDDSLSLTSLGQLFDHFNFREEASRGTSFRLTRQRLATALNTIYLDPHDPRDIVNRYFALAGQFIKADIKELASKNILTNEVFVNRAKQLVSEEIGGLLKRYNRVLNELPLDNFAPNLQGPAGLNARALRRFIDDYSFLGTVEHLNERLNRKYGAQDLRFTLPALSKYRDTLRSRNQELEQRAFSGSNIATGLYTGGLASLFLPGPVGQFSASAMFLAGASIESFHTKNQSANWTRRQLDVIKVLSTQYPAPAHPQSGLRLQTPITEMYAWQQINQKAQKSRELSRQVFFPLTVALNGFQLNRLYSAWRSSNKPLASVIKTIPSRGRANLRKQYKLDNLSAATVTSKVGESLRQWEAYSVVLGTFAAYGAYKAYQSRQDYSDQQPTPFDPYESIERLETEKFLRDNAQAKRAQRFISNLLASLKESEQNLQIRYFEDYYSGGTWPKRHQGKNRIHFHDGHRIIKFFDTIYLPLKLLDENEGQNPDLIEELVYAVSFQSVAQVEVVNGLLQSSFIQLLDRVVRKGFNYDVNIETMESRLDFLIGENVNFSVRLQLDLEHLDHEARLLANAYRQGAER